MKKRPGMTRAVLLFWTTHWKANKTKAKCRHFERMQVVIFSYMELTSSNSAQRGGRTSQPPQVFNMRIPFPQIWASSAYEISGMPRN